MGCMVCLPGVRLGRGVGCVYGGRGTFSSKTKDSYAIALLMGRESWIGVTQWGSFLMRGAPPFFFSKSVA